jgi:hypothetical protein
MCDSPLGLQLTLCCKHTSGELILHSKSHTRPNFKDEKQRIGTHLEIGLFVAVMWGASGLDIISTIARFS